MSMLEASKQTNTTESGRSHPPMNSDTSRRAIVAARSTGNTWRPVEIPGNAAVRAQAEQRLKLGGIWKECGLIFPSRVGTPWLPRPFYRGYRVIVTRAGVEDSESVYFHTLRHTAASQWIRLGADIFTVSRRLGHASAAFTMDVYGHLLKGQQRVAAEALDHLLADAQ